MEEILNSLKGELNSITTINSLNEIKAKYLGKKGLVTEMSMKIKDLPKEERKDFGQNLNKLKNDSTNLIEEKKEEIEKEILNKKLENESIDINLPGTLVTIGAPSIVEKVVEDLEELMMSMGYDVVDGPELELDKYNFEMLNLPKGHPARDAQDTFYVKGDELLLRTQTSPVHFRRKRRSFTWHLGDSLPPTLPPKIPQIRP